MITSFSIFVLLLSAYNPYTTFIFNKTGFHGASLHQTFMISGWLIFVILNFKTAKSVITFRLIISLFLLLGYSTFSLINGANFGSLNASVADVAYFVEMWMFYVAALIAIKSISAYKILKIFRNVFIINGIGLISMYLFFKSDLYFTLQLGPVRVSRALDFLIISGLLMLLYSNRSQGLHRLQYVLFVILLVFATSVGFSRGVWLALIIVMILDISLRLAYNIYRLRIELKVSTVLISLFASLLIITIQSNYDILDLVYARLLDLDYDTASIGGRITAYLSLFIESFSNYDILLAGKGAGAYMPGLHIPASSSPSLFGTILYVHGLLIFALFSIALAVVTYRLFAISFRRQDQFGRFPIYNFLAHIIILNIFPSVSHFPVLGFLTFVSFVVLKTGDDL